MYALVNPNKCPVYNFHTLADDRGQKQMLRLPAHGVGFVNRFTLLSQV